MKKNRFVFITGIIVVLLMVSSLTLLFQKSFSASTTTFNQISNDVERYYNSLPSTHSMKVSTTKEEINAAVNLIKQYQQYVDELENYDHGDISPVYNALKAHITDGSAKVNIISGYIKRKWEMDALFEETTEGNGNLDVKYDNNVTKHFVYAICDAPEEERYDISFSSMARDVKERVEKLILVYQVTKDSKYLAALKLEIVTAAKWKNNWQSSQYIDTAEIAYAVSLGYDFAYGALTTSQRAVIENRLLLAVLLYGTKHDSEGIKKLNGNFNQVGHSGLGIAALTLIESSGQGNIKVTATDDESISIEYPVKSSSGNITYSDILIDNGHNAKLTNPDVVSLLKPKIKGSGINRYIPLRTLYSAMIATTTDYLPKVIKSNNTYIEGSYPEGKQYYLFGMKYFSYYLATLKNTLNTDYGLLNAETDPLKSKVVINNIVLNPVYMSNAIGQNINYADTVLKATDKEDGLFYLANLDAERGYERCAKVVYDYRKRTYHVWDFYSIIWYKEKNDAKNESIDYDEIFDISIYNNKYVKNNMNRIGVSAFRDSYTDTNGIFVAMKGGDSSANHSHLDLGSYVYYAMGTNWITDLGNGYYDSKKYHDKDYYRWQYIPTRAEAHSTIVINKPQIINTTSKGRVLAADQWKEAKASFEKFESSNSSNIAVVNLTDAYNKPNNDDTEYDSTGKIVTNSNKVKRGLKFFNNKKYVLIQDEVNLKNVTSYYSMVNVNPSNNIVTNIQISEDKKSVILTDNKNHQVKLILVSNNNSLKFINIDEVGDKDGYLNHFIGNPANNTNVSLEKNEGKLNHKKLVIYLHNTTPSTVNLKYGLFIIPIKENEPIDESLLTLDNLDNWYIPTPPEIKVYKNSTELNNNDTISGSAIIKIKSTSNNKPNEIIRYSLDSGATWYVYDENNSTDIQRRTISSIGNHQISVLSYGDDGKGIKGNQSELSNFTLNIEEAPDEPETPYEIHRYTVDETNKYIDMVDEKTNIDTFRNYITLADNYSVSINLGNKNYIYTGSKTNIYRNNALVVSYTNIVRGDIDGDGELSSLDYVKIRKHIMNTAPIKDNIYIKAADVNNDTKITSLDYVKIKNVIMKNGG